MIYKKGNNFFHDTYIDMKINSISFAQNINKTPLNAKKQVTKPIVSEQNPVINSKIVPYHLASRFNISFSSKQNEEFDFNKAAKELEEKINQKLNPDGYSPSKIKSALRVVNDASLISAFLQADNITDFCQTGVSLNGVLTYLKSKKQVNLDYQNCNQQRKSAFFVDELAVSYLEKMQIRDKTFIERLVTDFNDDNIKFYSFNEDETNLKDLKQRLERIFQSEIQIRQIETPTINEYKYPNADELMYVLHTMAKEKNLTVEQEEKFLEAGLKYLDKTLCCYSYQSLAKKCAEAYNKIENYAFSRGKTMDDVYYFIPNPNKSYEMINYLYAVENGIDVNKFIFNRMISGSRDREKIYVILDDCSLSGASMMEGIQIFNNSAFNQGSDIDLVFCPVLTTQKGKDRAKHAATMRFLTYIPLEECKTYNKVESVFQLIQDGFSPEEIEILANEVNAGFTGDLASIIFPYMIPDNSSEIVAKLGSYFLADNNNSANKAALFQIGKKAKVNTLIDEDIEEYN